MNIVQLLFDVKTQALDAAKVKVNALSNSTASATQQTGKLGQSFNALSNVPGQVGNIANQVGSVGSQALIATRSVSALGVGLGTIVAGVAGFAAIVAGIGSVGFAANKAADDADELAQKLGITINQLETMRLIANENGTSVEGLQRTYDKLSKSLNKLDDDNEKTQLAFAALVLTTQDLSNMTEQEIAGVVIKRWQELGMTSKATAATAQILGNSFRENIPAILAASEAAAGYSERIRKFASDATPDLVKAGGEQEKAMSDLGLAWGGLSNEVARWSGNMITTITNWAASALNSIRSVLAEFRTAQNVVAASQASISDKRRGELTKQARDEVYGSGNPNANEGDVNKRLKELLSQEQQSNFRKFELGQSEATYAGVAQAAEAKRLQAISNKVNMSPKRVTKEKEKKPEVMGPPDALFDEERKRLDEMSRRGLADLARQDAAEAAAEKQYKQLMQRIQVYKDIADPALRYSDLLVQIDEDYKSGALSATAYEEATKRVKVAMQDADETWKDGGFFGGMSKGLQDLEKQLLTTAETGRLAFDDFADKAGDAFGEFVTTGKMNLKSFVADFLGGIAKMIAKQLMLNAIKGAMGFYGFADGGAFTGGVQKFARGGMVNSPTVFGMSGGKMGVMGEAGPEAIMPLGRTSSGDLGVRMMGGGGFVINLKQDIHIGSVDSDERQAALLRELSKNTKALVKQGIAEEKRQGGMLSYA